MLVFCFHLLFQRLFHKDGLQIFKCLFGDAKPECEVYTIGQNKALQYGLNAVYEAEVDDEALAYAGKHGCALTQAVAYQLLHIDEIDAHGYLLLVDEHNVSVVAVTLHIHYFGTVQANQFIAGIYIQKFFWHSIYLCRLCIALPHRQ